MIVSASYRTDIPAFYGEWFSNRLAAGHCQVASPYGGPPSTVPLTRDRVDGFVFWTRNAKPFLPVLEGLAARNWPFVVQYTVTGYPRSLEPAVIPAAQSLAILRTLRDRYGPRAAVWRYDPVVVTSETATAYHVANFRELAAALAGTTDEVVVSFAQIYAKTRRNLDIAGRRSEFAWRDPSPEEKLSLLENLRGIASEAGMRLGLCGQRELLDGVTTDARCVDVERLSDVAGRPLEAPSRGHRPACGCAGSRDIGAYDSCTQGCAYCYAVRGRPVATERLARHDPHGEYLIPAKS